MIALRLGFLARLVQECLKGRSLPLQADEYVGAGAWSGNVLLNVPWSGSKEVHTRCG